MDTVIRVPLSILLFMLVAGASMGLGVAARHFTLSAQVVEHSTQPDEVKVIRLIDGTQAEINHYLAKYPEYDFGCFTHRFGLSPTLYLHRRKQCLE